ncbi:hypothetical protein MAR_022880 [Mya arenaria]|uniref:Uncharacterized protein n=1 Tax=Mya arenaria TaxID=6604 RepID=A0ABY7DP56_MYAAR|nr:hypothetical protein MAR_022880 [Mya arenaria]
MKIKNTVMKTKSDLGRLSDWLRRDGEVRELENIPPTELDFWQGYGAEYVPDTFKGIQSSEHRYLQGIKTTMATFFKTIS